MLRIACWTASYLPELGGLQWSTYRLARAWQDLGCTVQVITRATDLDGSNWGDVPVVRFPGESVRDWAISSSSWLAANSDSFDIVYVVDYFYKSIDEQLDLLNQIPVPVVLKTPTGGYISRLINNSRRRKGLQGLDAFVALNYGIRDELLAVGIHEGKIHLLSNGIDSKIFQPSVDSHSMRLDLGLPVSVPLAVYIGRFVARKRLDVLLKAMSNVDVPLALVLVGSGFDQRDSTESGIIQMASRMENVIVREPTSCPLKYLQACNIHVLVSDCEGMPNSVLEGMSCGLATIATQIPGITEVITHMENGLLVAPGNSEGTKQALSRLASDRDLSLSLGKKARQLIEERFEIKLVANRHLRLFKDLAERR